MASDDLRDRIRRGDLDAFTDPTLPVYLLGELGAPWWVEGIGAMSQRIVRILDFTGERFQTASVMLAPIGVAVSSATKGQAVPVRVGAVAVDAFAARRWLDLARGEVSAAQYVPREITDALAVVERYLPTAMHG